MSNNNNNNELFQKCDMCGVKYAISELKKANPYTDHLHCPRCWEYANGIVK